MPEFIEVNMHKVFGKKENEKYVDRKGAYIIPIRGDEVGVVETPKGFFLLGGGLDADETDFQCIERECMEEAGYAVEIKGEVGSAETYTLHPTIGYFHPIQTYYVGELLNKLKEPIEPDHVFKFVRFDDIRDKMYLEMQKWAIEQAMSMTNRDLQRKKCSVYTINRKGQAIMQKIMLKQLSLDMAKSEYDMLQGISAVENGFTNPAYNLSYDEYKEWLRITDNNSIGKDLPEGWIPFTTYFLYIDGIPVGYGRVRHSSSEYLETVVGAGNLGYGIAKEFRGKGYGSVLFKELLKKCKEIGYKEIKLFPMKSNEPTVKIMLKNGGQIIGDFKDLKYIIRIPLE